MNPDKPRHEKITTYSIGEDDTINIKTDSYYNTLAHTLEEREKILMTSFNQLKQDVDKALDHILVDKSMKLVLTIEAPTKTKPMRIVKRWVTIKKEYPRY